LKAVLRGLLLPPNPGFGPFHFKPVQSAGIVFFSLQTEQPPQKTDVRLNHSLHRPRRRVAHPSPSLLSLNIPWVLHSLATRAPYPFCARSKGWAYNDSPCPKACDVFIPVATNTSLPAAATIASPSWPQRFAATFFSKSLTVTNDDDAKQQPNPMIDPSSGYSVGPR
jgi:hypothetical protein